MADTMARVWVVYRTGCREHGARPLLGESEFLNCLPRSWSHVSDCFMSAVASGFIIDVDSITPVRAFIAMTHVEELTVEHVLALACIMRLLEKRYSVDAELAYATVYGALPPVVIIAYPEPFEHNDALMEALGEYINDPDAAITEVDAASDLDAVLKALGYTRVEWHPCTRR